MKKIIYTLLSLTLLLLTGCYEDASYVVPTDIATYLSKSPKNGAAVVGNYMLLRDMSQNALSHEWIITDTDPDGNDLGTGCERLRFFTTVLDTSTVMNGCKSNFKDAYILFKKSGWAKVTLRNTFKNKVVSNSANPIEAVYDKEKGVWVYEQSWKVECYGELKPALKIYLADEMGNEQGDPILEVNQDENTDLEEMKDIKIKQGQLLKFVYDENSEYKATGWSFNVPGGKAETDIADNVYSFNTATTMGKEYTGFNIVVTRNVWNDVPAATASKKIPMRLTVEKSKLVLRATELQQLNAKNLIQVPFNKKIDPTTISDDIIQDFTLKVSSNGNIEHTFTPTSITVSNNSLILKFEGIEKLDTYDKSVTLSYEANSSRYFYGYDDADKLLPTDSFNDENIALSLNLKRKYFSFDNTDPAPANIYEGWWMKNISTNTTPEGSFIFRKDELDGQVNSLGFDIKGTLSGDTWAQFSSALENDVKLAPGNYNFKFKMYVESITGNGTISFFCGKINGTKVDPMLVVAHQINEENVTKGKWITYEYTFTIPEGTEYVPSGFRVKAVANSFSGSTKLYVDDLYLERAE